MHRANYNVRIDVSTFILRASVKGRLFAAGTAIHLQFARLHRIRVVFSPRNAFLLLAWWWSAFTFKALDRSRAIMKLISPTRCDLWTSWIMIYNHVTVLSIAGFFVNYYTITFTSYYYTLLKINTDIVSLAIEISRWSNVIRALFFFARYIILQPTFSTVTLQYCGNIVCARVC